MTIKELLETATTKLAVHNGNTPQLDVELLISYALGRSRTWLYTYPEYVISKMEQSHIEQLIERRIKGEPIAYITGEKAFWTLNMKVSPATLIPRPDTECLVEAILNLVVSKDQSLLDLGTGTGAIALAISSERPDWQVTGVDIKASAVALANENALLNNIPNVVFKQSNWFEKTFGQTFDLIAGNPPYIEEKDPHLTKGDVRFEPHLALVSGKDGLDDIQIICQQAPQYLNHNGWLLLEHGCSQTQNVKQLFMAAGFSNIETLKDLAGLDRVTKGQLCHE